MKGSFVTRLLVVVGCLVAGFAAAYAKGPARSSTWAGRAVTCIGIVVQTGPKPFQVKPLSRVRFHDPVSTVGKGRAKLLLDGGCVVRLGTATTIRLLAAGKPGACPGVELVRGSVSVTVGRNHWLAVKTGSRRIRLKNGRGFVSAGGKGRTCALDGQVMYFRKVPPADPAQTDSSETRPEEGPWHTVARGSCRSV